MFKETIKSESKSDTELLEHACDICPRTFKTLPGLKRHKTSHSRKPQENICNDYIYIIILFQLVLFCFYFSS